MADALQSSDSTARQFITFAIGEEEYGVDIMAVVEIKGWSPATPIPRAPDYVRGVINLRGAIVPIYDLRARFGMESMPPSRSNVVIIVRSDTRVLGMLVDAVSDIVETAPEDIRPVPKLDQASTRELIEGLVVREDRMISLVSLPELFPAESATTAAVAAMATEAA